MNRRELLKSYSLAAAGFGLAGGLASFADAEEVRTRHMEDVIQTYLLPYDPQYPVVCFDEACKQMFGEDQHHEPAMSGPAPGQPETDGQGSGCLGTGAKRSESTHPLDLHSRRRTAKTAKTLPVNRRLTGH